MCAHRIKGQPECPGPQLPASHLQSHSASRPTMSSPSPVSVLVVGAGPAGLVLALALAKNGISLRIIEKETQRLAGQRGAGIMSRSLELYNYLGVLPDILAKAKSPPPMRKYKLPGGVEPLSTFHISPPVTPTPACPYLNSAMLGQESVEAILRAHLEQLGVHVEYGTRLQTFEQHSDRVVAHTIKADAGEEKEHDITCHWLVGTDGARGVVRKQLGLQFLGTPHEDLHFVIGDVVCKGLDEDYWHSWGEVAGDMVLLRPTEHNGVFSLMAGGHISPATLVSDRAELVKFVHKTTERDDLEISDIRSLFEYRPNVRMVDKFGEGRVFVAGDAAHVHSATGGQGLNSSIQDSFNLGWKLALVENGFAAPSLLSTYSEERLPVIAAMLQRTTVLLNKTVSGSVDAWDRGGVLKQLGVNCRWSSIVVDERSARGDPDELMANAYGGGGGILCAGDRAPDAPGLVDAEGGTTSFFRLFGATHHTVVFFAADVHRVAELLGALAECPPKSIRAVLVLPQGHPGVSAETVHGVDTVVTDRDGHAYAGYAVSKESVVAMVVRPDGIVGGIVLGVAGLRRYFGGVFGAYGA
ncbi:monooxygenase [Amylocystis lapponica]|nr:monooxygenase [Amylocystis lapponica]